MSLRYVQSFSRPMRVFQPRPYAHQVAHKAGLYCLTGWLCTLLPSTLFPSEAAGQSHTIQQILSQPFPEAEKAGEIRRAVQSEQPQKALELLAKISSSRPEAARYLSYLKAQALAQSGALSLALTELDSLPKPKESCVAANQDVLSYEPLLLKAALLEKKSPLEAAQIYSSDSLPHQAWLKAIEIYQRAKKTKQVHALEKKLLVSAPALPETKALAKKLGPKGVKQRLETIELRLKRLGALLSRHQNKEAHQEAEALLKELGEKHEHSCQLAYISGKSLRKQRNYGGAIKRLSQGKRWCHAQKKEGLAVSCALIEARVRSIRRQVKGTQVVAEWFKKNYPKHSYADDAIRYHAKVLESKRRHKEAAKIYQYLRDNYAQGDQVSPGTWRLAFAYIQKGQLKQAKPLLLDILANAEARPEAHHRANYWLARAEEKSAPQAALKRYRKLVFGHSFYSWLALDHLTRIQPKWAKELKAELIRLIDAHQESPAAAAIIQAPFFSMAKYYAAAGAPELAQGELNKLACEGPFPIAELVSLAEAYAFIGAHTDAQHLLRWDQRKLVREPFAKENIGLFRMAYSRPYSDLIRKAAQAEKIEPLLLTALAREESTFDPDIVSWAGATGLAQLMPSTAVGAYADVFGGRLNMSKLTDPELNLRLGAHVLKEGLRGFKNTVPLALSAYNGGHGLTRRFLKTKPQVFELWVETVSVKENRRYIKRIVETWGIYRLLWGEKERFAKLPLQVSR